MADSYGGRHAKEIRLRSGVTREVRYEPANEDISESNLFFFYGLFRKSCGWFFSLSLDGRGVGEGG
jgi:hypothetical protein